MTFPFFRVLTLSAAWIWSKPSMQSRLSRRFMRFRWAWSSRRRSIWTRNIRWVENWSEKWRRKLTATNFSFCFRSRRQRKVINSFWSKDCRNFQSFLQGVADSSENFKFWKSCDQKRRIWSRNFCSPPSRWVWLLTPTFGATIYCSNGNSTTATTIIAHFLIGRWSPTQVPPTILRCLSPPHFRLSFGVSTLRSYSISTTTCSRSIVTNCHSISKSTCSTAGIKWSATLGES